MKIFVPCRHTLGDVLSGYFCPINYGRPNLKAQLLARLRNARRAGACTSAFVVSRFGFWKALDFPLDVRSNDSFGIPLPENGWERDELEGHVNILRSPPALLEFAAEPHVVLPMREPTVVLPEHYILFSDGAGTDDRGLADRNIVAWLQSYLPVVRIGNSTRHYKLPMGPQGSTVASVDIADSTELTEVFWLAKHARMIVSPCTYLRTMSLLAGTPVLELLQCSRAEQKTISRTIKEYCGREYGMRPGEKNFWCFWDGKPSAEAQRHVQNLLQSHKPIAPNSDESR